jgi:hypothetical protein
VLSEVFVLDQGGLQQGRGDPGASKSGDKVKAAPTAESEEWLLASEIPEAELPC